MKYKFEAKDILLVLGWLIASVGVYAFFRKCEENKRSPSLRFVPASEMPNRPDGVPARGWYTPYGGLVINEDFRNDPRLMNHELQHWKQHQRLGTIGFYVQYFKELMQYDYYTMPMEVEAKYAEGPFCQENKGWCETKPTPYYNDGSLDILPLKAKAA